MGETMQGTTGTRYQVLALSGGGYLGLYTATILAELEETLGGDPLLSRFDMVAGTSIGGILALGVALGIPMRTIAGAFAKQGEAIFSARPAPRSSIGILIDLFRMMGKPKYNGVALRKTIEELVGEHKLADLRRPCLVPAVNMTKGGPQVFKTPHHPDFRRDWRLKVVDVGMATSAAPAFFPLASIGDELFADGGLFANSPDLIAVHEAEHFMGVSRNDIHVLSVGTTTSKFSFSHAMGRSLGALAWAKRQRLLQATIASQQQVTDAMLRHRLGSRYLRLDTSQSPEQAQDLALDVAHEGARRTIRGLAENTVRESSNNPVLARMLEHRSRMPTFYYGAQAGQV